MINLLSRYLGIRCYRDRNIPAATPGGDTPHHFGMDCCNRRWPGSGFHTSYHCILKEEIYTVKTLRFWRSLQGIHTASFTVILFQLLHNMLLENLSFIFIYAFSS